MGSRTWELKHPEAIGLCSEVSSMKQFSDMRTDDICFSHNETWFKLLLKN